MTTPSNAEKNIRLARFAFPDIKWVAGRGGYAVDQSNPLDMFNVVHPGDRTVVIIKLKQDHNIDIKKRTRSGRTVWEAVTHGENMRGFEPHEDLSELLYRLVEGLVK